VVQLLFFGFFMVVSVVFYWRLNRKPTRRSKSGEVAWRPHMWLLFTASLLIWIRLVFRVVEYVQGPDGYLLSHEIYMYIFDAILMAAVVLLFNVVHPSQITALLSGRKAVCQVLGVENKAKLVSQEEDVEEQTHQFRDVMPMAALGRSEYAPR
jgi:RTA1 like protein